jgi:hypothetical protein
MDGATALKDLLGPAIAKRDVTVGSREHLTSVNDG